MVFEQYYTFTWNVLHYFTLFTKLCLHLKVFVKSKWLLHNKLTVIIFYEFHLNSQPQGVPKTNDQVLSWINSRDICPKNQFRYLFAKLKHVIT